MLFKFRWVTALCLAVALPAAAQTAPPLKGEPIGGAPLTLRGEPIAGPPATNAPASATPVIKTNTPAAASANGKVTTADFDTLASFNFERGIDAPVTPADAPATTKKILAQIPDTIKALDGKPVAVRGFMLPMKVEDGMVYEFLLLKSQMGCCFGISPGINEWVNVQTGGKGVKPLMDDLITVYGTMHVGEYRENGYLTGIYKMDCEKVQ